MAVSSSYMLEKPPPPAAWKVFFDLEVLPVMIDTVAGMEGAIEVISGRARATPARSVGVALGIGYALGWLTTVWRSRPTR